MLESIPRLPSLNDHERQRHSNPIYTIIVCGAVANICVHYSAAIRWYDVIHPVDALSALTEFDYHAALRQAAFLFNATLTTVDGLVQDG